MASKGITSKKIGLTLTVAALIADLAQAAKHQQTCPKCMNRDFISIALDVDHLLQLT